MALKSTQSRAVLPYLYHRLTDEEQGYVIAISGEVVPSNQPEEEYAGLSSVEPMTEVTGVKASKDPIDYVYKLRNKRFQTGLRVMQEELLYDKTQQVQMRIDDLVARYQNHWNKLISRLLLDGATGTAYDGVSFFNANHPSNAGVQSNLTSYNVGTPATPTKDEMHAAIFTAVQTLLALNDDEGEPMNEGLDRFVVIVPPQFMGSAVGALNSELLSQGGTNDLRVSGLSFQLGVSPRLSTWTDKFVVAAADGRAMRRQQVEGPMILPKDEPRDIADNGFHEYKVEAIRNAGYGSWQSATLVTLT